MGRKKTYVTKESEPIESNKQCKFVITVFVCPPRDLRVQAQHSNPTRKSRSKVNHLSHPHRDYQISLTYSLLSALLRLPCQLIILSWPRSKQYQSVRRHAMHVCALMELKTFEQLNRFPSASTGRAQHCVRWFACRQSVIIYRYSRCSSNARDQLVGQCFSFAKGQ